MESERQRHCARCGAELAGRPNYALRDRLYCGDCVDVMRELIGRVAPEPVGMYRSWEDRDAEVVAWLGIMESLLEDRTT